MKTKLFTIKLIGFKQNGTYSAEYNVSDKITYIEDDGEICPYLPDVIKLIVLAKSTGWLPKKLDYFIKTKCLSFTTDSSVPHIVKIASTSKTK
jgi:hypothetical protein